MRFFEDFKVSKDVSIGITSLLSNITTRAGSHKGGWARLLKCQLKQLGYDNVEILDNKDNLSSFGAIIFDLGAEYSGAINLFGGLDAKVYQRLLELKEYSGQLFSWRNELPNLESLQGRRNNKSTCESFKNEPDEFLTWVQAQLSKTQVFDHVYRTDKLLLGDSHTPSVWTPEYMIERRDGRTLQGMIDNKTIDKYIKKFAEAGVVIKHIHLHCSSIDIRHHVCREFDHDVYTESMVMAIASHLEAGNFESVIINHTMGIEDESRELPKTGYYKGTPFCGPWEKRNESRLVFNQTADDYATNKGWKSLEFPKYFFDKSGKLRFDVMEVPQSVHLSPEHYRWDLDNNKLRWTEVYDLEMQVKFAQRNMMESVEKAMYGT